MDQYEKSRGGCSDPFQKCRRRGRMTLKNHAKNKGEWGGQVLDHQIPEKESPNEVRYGATTFSYGCLMGQICK